jgi:methionyl-tRNA synthetase
MDELKNDIAVTMGRVDEDVVGASHAIDTQVVVPEPVTLDTQPETINYASIDDFAKIEIKIGQILSAEAVEGSDKLLKLAVDFGETVPRQVLSGIAKFVTIDQLVGQKFPFVTNLKPRKMMGMESQAMILAVNDDVNFALLKPTTDIKVGSPLR